MALQRCIYRTLKQITSSNPITKRPQLSYCKINCRYSSSQKYFTDRHEWITVDQNKGTVGISQYAQELLGDVVFAQLPDVGQKFAAGDECGALESVKAASEVYTPVSGTIVEKNKSVEEKPGLVNSSCYEEGWLFKIELSDSSEISKLMSQSQYDEYIHAQKEKEA